MKHFEKFGSVTNLPTPYFLAPMDIGEKISFSTQGRNFGATLESVTEIGEDGFSVVTYDLNGEKHKMRVKAKSPKQPPFVLRKAGAIASVDSSEKKEKADPSNPGSVGASLPGKVLEVKVKVGDSVSKGDPVVILSSMKLQLTVTAPISGKVQSVKVGEGDSISVGDLLFLIK